jgi:hypothetical protein
MPVMKELYGFPDLAHVVPNNKTGFGQEQMVWVNIIKTP